MKSVMTSDSQKEGVMKIHNDFTLFFRVVPSGKRVVYYYAYDEDGRRQYGRSTGETTLTAARVKCNRLFKEGVLGKRKEEVPTFAEYALGWWEWETCEYLKKRRKRFDITKNYADHSKRVLEKVLIPHFGGFRMDRITVDAVEGFIDSYIKRGYKNNTINSYFNCLKTMMIEAEERNVIVKNPLMKMGKLKNNRKEIQIITPEEFKKLFVGDWQKVWDEDRVSCTANKLAAVTGMRSSELMGLKGCYVYDEHIYVCMQYDVYGYRPTKGKDRSNLPLPASLIEDLKELKKLNGDGFVFSSDGGATPVNRALVYRGLHRALMNIGISKEQIAERKLHLHAWRHFFNTQLLKNGLSVKQTQAITRHKSERMTESYLHFDSSDFVKAREVQDDLLRPVEKKPQEQAAASEAQPRLTVLPFPMRETTERERKQA